MIKRKIAPEIVLAAFKTVYPDKDFYLEKERWWSEWKKQVAAFPTLDSNAFYRKLVVVIFYSGMKAKTVSSKKRAILNHLGDYKEVAAYDENDVLRICSVKDMIKNKQKISACIENAKEFIKIDKEFGSFKDYLLSFNRAFPADYSGVPELLSDLQKRFKFLGPRTSRHFLMIFGFPIIKPDRMVVRVLSRLGLIAGESDQHNEEAVKVCLKAAEEVGIPYRMMDSILVGIGQSEGVELCRKKNPLCGRCGLKPHCNYFRLNVMNTAGSAKL